MKKPVLFMTQAAVIAAAYAVLTFLSAQFAFGPVQLRLAEALTVLPAITPAAIPGLFVGCLIANLVNPMNLGPVDILCGSLSTLLAAWLTYVLQKRLRPKSKEKRHNRLSLILVLSPAVVVNALVVGFYLPFLIPGMTVSIGTIALTMLSLFLSQSLVVYLIGLPLLLALEKIHLPSLG